MLPLMRMLRISVRDDHLGERDPVKDWSFVAFVVVSNVVKYDAFSVVEANMHLPVLPLDDSTVNLEGHTLRLRYVDWLYVLPIAALSFDCSRVVIARRSFVHGPPNWRDIDVDDFLCIGIENRSEVEGKGVLAIIHVRSIVHQRLL